MNILIDAGHGGSDPGACGNGIKESDFTLAAAKMLMWTLRQRNFVAHLTRDTDTSLGYNKGADLQARCDIANKWPADLFVSIHANAAMNGTAHGFEVWTSPGRTQADVAAEEIVQAMAHAFPNRLIRRDLSDGDGDKESDFYVLKHTKMPAVLIEMGFVTNSDDVIWMRENFKGSINAIADGIQAFASLRDNLEDCG